MSRCVTILILCTVVFSSCRTTTINGYKIKERATEKAKADQQTHFYMTVSFWLSYGISYHFLHKE